MSGELATTNGSLVPQYETGFSTLLPAQISAQVKLIQDVMKSVMREDEHYGVIPGTNKPSLYKSGAEKLCITFRLRPEFDIQETLLPREHKEFRVVCRLYSIGNGAIISEGVGICSTMETKYRFRSGEKKMTGRPVPKAYWSTRDQALLGGKGYTAAKNDQGVWEICEKGEPVEFTNPSDNYNTVIKMAKKRAFVDATITATGASDIFTQDVEDLVDNGVIVPEKNTEKPKETKPKEAKPRETKPKEQKTDTPKATAQAASSEPDMNVVDSLISMVKEGNNWNGKVYAGNTLYLNNHKFSLQESELELFLTQIEEIKNAAAEQAPPPAEDSENPELMF